MLRPASIANRQFRCSFKDELDYAFDLGSLSNPYGMGGVRSET